MTWNYRIMKTKLRDGTFHLGIHEVYYDDKTGEPSSYSERIVDSPRHFFESGPDTEDKSEAVEETKNNIEALNELRTELYMMIRAFDKPVLTEEDFATGEVKAEQSVSSDMAEAAKSIAAAAGGLLHEDAKARHVLLPTSDQPDEQ